MEEGLLNNNILRETYLNLKKFSDQIKKDHRRIMEKDLDINDSEEERRKLVNHLRIFMRLLKEVERHLNNTKEIESLNEDIVLTVKDGVEIIKNTVQPLAREIRDKIGECEVSDFEYQENHYDYEDDDKEEQKQEQIEEGLMDNKEYLEQREKEIKQIYKAAALIKDIVLEKNKKEAFLSIPDEHVIKEDVGLV